MHKKSTPTRQQASAAPAVRPTRRTRGRTTLALACMAAGVTGTTFQAQVLPMVAGAVQPAASAVAAPVQAAAAVPQAAVQAAVAVAASVATAPAAPKAAAAPLLQPHAATARVPFPTLGVTKAGASYFEQLRAQMRWVPVQVGERRLATPDASSRLLLAQSAAQRAGLHQVGLDWRDVYGVINAETSWVPRTGMGKNGVASFGLGQFEPATARAVGLRNPNDPVEAVHATAVLLKEAARWSARRIEPLNLSPAAEARKLREGVSIYYNLSTRARSQWSGTNTHRFPVETQRHIRNVQNGARQAEQLLARVAGGELPAPATMQVAFKAPAGSVERSSRAAAAKAPARTIRTASAGGQGSIAWSGGAGARKVWVTQQGRVRWTSSADS